MRSLRDSLGREIRLASGNGPFNSLFFTFNFELSTVNFLNSQR
jgi:hypothetical protein